MKRGEKICVASAFIFGSLVLLGGIIVLILMPQIVRHRVENDVALTDGSFAERTWREPPFAISMQFWIFDVMNADDVVKHGATPALVQKGPYGYREEQRKESITFLSGNTVSYVNRKEYFWDPALSCSTCLESDTFTVPNIPYLSAMKIIRDNIPDLGPLVSILKQMLHTFGERPFVSNVKAHELLFDGYNDVIFNFINKFKKGVVPERMGLFYGKNSTNDGQYIVRTGADNIYSVGRVMEWEKHMDLYWTGWWRSGFPEANMINGTDGTVYRPFVKRSDALPMFIRDICRSIYMTYESDVNFRGMTAYRFTTPPEVFNANLSANRGFCWPSKERYYSESIQPEESGRWCLPSGMLDVSKCQSGAPLVVTPPQFASCPEEVKDSVSGLYPESEEFVTFVDVEPTTGVMLSAARKIQLNVAVHSDSVELQGVFSKMKSVILPIVWLNESVLIDDGTFDYVFTHVVTDQKAAYVSGYAAVGLGAIVLLCLILVMVYMLKRRGGASDLHHSTDILPESTDSNA